MPGPTYGPSGLQIQTATEIQADLAAYLASEFGVSIQATNGQAVIGELVSALSQVLLLHQEGIDGIYQSLHVDGAAGVNLDRLAQWLGLTRNAATFSTVGVDIANSDGIGHAVPQGAIVQHVPTGKLFGVVAGVVSPAAGSIAANLRALDSGPIVVLAGDAWAWVTSFAGSTFLTVTNAAAGVPGTSEETDADLRIRILASAHLPGKGTVQAIRSAIADLDGVTYCQVFENTAITPGILVPVAIPGLPGKSFVAVVVGGVAADIAALIFAQKPAGIATYGNTATVVTDSEGYLHTILFETAAAQAIWASVRVAGVTTAFDTAIKDAIISYVGGTLSTGDVVQGLSVGATIVASALEAAIFDATKINGKSTCTGVTLLKFDTVFPAVNTANLPLAWNRYPATLGANITVTH